MELSKVHPELRKTIRRIPPLPFHRRSFVILLNAMLRFIPKAQTQDGISIEETDISKHVSVRIYRPLKNAGAALLWIHGGGLLGGRAAQDDKLCIRYARELGLLVVSVEYRLAPRHPFPAAIDDCFTAWTWLLQRASFLGIDPQRIAIGGQSAGGGLAASLAQRILDTGGIQPAAQSLYCPMLDDRTAANQALDALNHRLWHNRSNRAGWSAYLEKAPGAPTVPEYAVPARRENLTGLPPAWIGVGDIDLFYAEDMRYGEQLQAHGVSCEFHIAPQAPHGFETVAPRSALARALFQSNFEFLRKTLHIPN